MRLPYRNKKATLWVMFGIVVVTMFLFKFTELRPMCFFRDESLASASASASASINAMEFFTETYFAFSEALIQVIIE